MVGGGDGWLCIGLGNVCLCYVGEKLEVVGGGCEIDDLV